MPGEPGASSLYELAKQRLIQNINMLDDIGDLPYDFLAPILKHIQNPQQLQDLESRCPQLLGETGEIWLRFVKRDVPDWDKKAHQPKDPKKWSIVYRKLTKAAEREKKEQEDQLKEKMRALQQNKAGNQTTIIEGRLPPSAMRRPWGSSAGGGGGGSSSRWGAPGAPAKTGKKAHDMLRKSMFDQKRERPKATQMPTHLLQQRKATVQKAPERMIRSAGPSHLTAAKRSVPAADRQSASNNNTTTTDPRPSLPTGQHFAAPKLRTQSATPGQKRKREEPNLFMQRKR